MGLKLHAKQTASATETWILFTEKTITQNIQPSSDLDGSYWISQSEIKLIIR